MTRLLDGVPVTLRSFANLAAWTAIGALVHEALAYLLAEIGIVARMLSPTAGAATYVALAVLLFLYALRFALVFVAPPVLAASLVRGVAALLDSGNPPPTDPSPRARDGRARAAT